MLVSEDAIANVDDGLGAHHHLRTSLGVILVDFTFVINIKSSLCS